MEHEFIAHHIKEDSGLVHLIASMQPRKYLEDYSKHSMKHWRILEALKALDNVFKSTQHLQDSATKSSGACQTGTLLVLCNVMNKICKCTDTTVAFTQEYSRVSYALRNVSTLSTGLGSSKDTHTLV